MDFRAAEVASDCAWRTYLSFHSEVDEDDDRRIALQRCINNLFQAGVSDPDVLQAVGLAYLQKLDRSGAEREERLARYRALDKIT
jgi:hypothetical protein